MVKVVNDGVVMFHRVGEARVETYCGMFETYKRGILKWTKIKEKRIVPPVFNTTVYTQ